MLKKKAILEKFKFSDKLTSQELLPNMDYPFFERVKQTGFFHKKNDFSLVNACFLAEAAFLAYNHPAFIKFAFYYAGFDEFKAFLGRNVAKCFVAKRKNSLIVVFRGTDYRFPDIIHAFIADLKITMSPERDKGLVHSGFQAVLDEIWEGKGMLYEHLSEQKEKNPSLRIFFAGHSLGGALSLISASRFPAANCVYTFGCPRAGNKEFTDSIKPNVYRIVNNNDIVTELPLKKIIIIKTADKYSHAGELKFINSEGKLKNKNENKLALLENIEEMNLPAKASFFEEFVVNLVKTRASYFVDHSPYYYAAKLWNIYHDLPDSE
ncbi:MAG: lipase family protein [Spirochaetes bacterium]|nr:lipase family protein [Spirochaetota bacterium]